MRLEPESLYFALMITRRLPELLASHLHSRQEAREKRHFIKAANSFLEVILTVFDFHLFAQSFFSWLCPGAVSVERSQGKA